MLNQFDLTWDVMAKHHEGFSPHRHKVQSSSSSADTPSRCIARLLENPYNDRMSKYMYRGNVDRNHTDTHTKTGFNTLPGHVEPFLVGDVKSP